MNGIGHFYFNLREMHNHLMIVLSHCILQSRLHVVFFQDSRLSPS